jgi:hypothetical protein
VATGNTIRVQCLAELALLRRLKKCPTSGRYEQVVMHEKCSIPELEAD